MPKRASPPLIEDLANAAKRQNGSGTVERAPKTKNITIDPDGDLLLILTKRKKAKVVVDTSKHASDQEDYNTSSLDELLPAGEHEFQVLVSSKHMSLASPIFRAMLAPNSFIEGRTLAANGKVEVPLPDDDATALTLLLYIIHGQTNQVSAAISLDLLAQVAVLVDKYRLQDATKFFSGIWMKHAQERSKSFYANIEKWLCISWVFRNETLFNEVVETAVINSDQDFGSAMDDLPLPSNLIEDIKKARIQAIAPILEVLDTFAAILKSDADGLCPRKSKTGQFCNMMLCGSFMRSCTRNGIQLSGLWVNGARMPLKLLPVPFSQRSLIEKVKFNFEYRSICTEWKKSPTTDHGLRVKVTSTVDKCVENCKYPRLQDYTT